MNRSNFPIIYMYIYIWFDIKLKDVFITQEKYLEYLKLFLFVDSFLVLWGFGEKKFIIWSVSDVKFVTVDVQRA